MLLSTIKYAIKTQLKTLSMQSLANEISKIPDDSKSLQIKTSSGNCCYQYIPLLADGKNYFAVMSDASGCNLAASLSDFSFSIYEGTEVGEYGTEIVSYSAGIDD